MSALPNPAADADSLKAGLAALKQGRYASAIALLTDVVDRLLHLDPNHPQGLKGQMGLVVAYDRTHQPDRAIVLCTPLTTSPNPQVKAWADRTLADLHQRHPELGSASAIMPPTTPTTGFVPLAPQETAPAARPVFVPRRPRSGSETAGSDVSVPDIAASPQNERTSPQSRESAAREAKATAPESPPVPPANPVAPARPPAERATKWQALPRLHPLPLILAQLGTPIAVFLMLGLLAALNLVLPSFWFEIKTTLLRWSSIPPYGPIPWVEFGFMVVVLWITSPWLLDTCLRLLYGMQPLSTAHLARYSPETHRLIQRFCQKQQLPLLQLGVLPHPAPLAFTYGCLPQQARIVVSQGLLETLADDEIATIYARELGHIHSGDFSAMALFATVTQIPYGLYWLAAQGADWLQARSQLRRGESAYLTITLGIAAHLMALVAAFGYSLYWMFRWPGLWLAKQRVVYADRFACNLTGNPNGLTRALLKIATTTAQTIHHQQYTDYGLESWELLTPLSYPIALTMGSPSPIDWPAQLAWDRQHPARNWLGVNQGQPLLGDRLHQLSQYAHQWHLTPELAFTDRPATQGWRMPLPQATPFIGLAAGVLLAALFWVTGWSTYLLGFRQFIWMASDYKLFSGFPLIGFGLGILLRFNHYFPELEPITRGSKFSAPPSRRSRSTSPSATAPDGPNPPPPSDSIPLHQLLAQSDCSLKGQPTVLEGKLLGRRGHGNGLAQDLLLQTATGTLKLHYCSQIGVLGNLLPQATRPVDLIGQPVTAIGWLHRGATPWMDVDSLRSQGGRSVRSGHQIWAVVVATISTLLGIRLIL
jgi:Zn-dependent protease with chaperone function